MADENRKSDTPADGQAPDNGPAFPTIGEPDNTAPETYLGDFKTREEAEDWFKATKPRLDEFDSFRKEAQEREQRYQDTINRLISTSAPQSHAPAGQGDDFSRLVDGLPDPVEKPEDFRRAMGGVIKTIAGTVQNQQVQQSRSAALNEFHREFGTKHADLAKFSVIRDAALNSEADAITKRGGDPFQAWSSDPAGFIDRVGRRTREMLTEMGIDPAAQTQPANNGAPSPNRTGGIPGGTGAVNGNGSHQPRPTTFVSELTNLQEQDGYY